MNLDSDKLLFSLNSEYCPNKCYGFVRRSIFELFSNKTDWTFSMRCRIGDSSKNYINLLSLEGADLDLCLSNFKFSLITSEDDNTQINTSLSLANLLENRIN